MDLIRIRVAKAQLYEAKVGVVVLQKKWSQAGLGTFLSPQLLYRISADEIVAGTSIQQRMKQLMTTRERAFRNKYKTYNDQVETFNNRYRRQRITSCPPLEELKRIDFEDAFWNDGFLTHPNEPWAVDPTTQEGIQAWLTVQRCNEELPRLAREARQLLRSTLWTKTKLDELARLAEIRKWISIPEASDTQCGSPRCEAYISFLFVVSLGPGLYRWCPPN